MDLSFETAEYRQNPDCPICGDDHVDSIDGIEYTSVCAIGAD
jgi:adenylyltransferase/sulfurtransferase